MDTIWIHQHDGMSLDFNLFTADNDQLIKIYQDMKVIRFQEIRLLRHMGSFAADVLTELQILSNALIILPPESNQC